MCHCVPQVRFPRRTLAQRFAVLLMQSCYKAADALDFIPMVRLEKDLMVSKRLLLSTLFQACVGTAITRCNSCMADTGQSRHHVDFPVVLIMWYSNPSFHVAFTLQVCTQRCVQSCRVLPLPHSSIARI